VTEYEGSSRTWQRGGGIRTSGSPGARSVLFTEGLAQLGFLLVAEVRANELGVRLSEGAADSVDDGVLAHEKQGGGTRCHLITHGLDEVVADAEVRHGADQGSGRGADRRTDQRDEEDQTEQESPKRTTECPAPVVLCSWRVFGFFLWAPS